MTPPLRQLIPFALLGLGALTLAAWLTFLRPTAGEPPTVSKPDATATAPPSTDGLAEADRAPLDAPGTAVRLLAELHGSRIEPLLALTAQMPHRALPGDAPDAPTPVNGLAQRLIDKAPPTQLPPTSSFERAMLVGALGRAVGLTPAYAVVAGTRFSATELLARTFAVRFADGPWHVLPTLPPLTPTRRLAEAPEVRPLTPPALLATSLAFRAMGLTAARALEDATRLVAVAARLMPDDPALIFLQGRLEYASGKADLARMTFERATRLATDPMTHYLLGRLARLDDRPAEALRHFTEAAIDTAFPEPRVELAELALERLDLTPRSEHAALIAEARSATRAARTIQPHVRGLRLAEAHLEALGDAPDTPLDANRHQATVALIEEETRLFPDSEEAWLLLAQVHAAADDDEAAIASLARAHATGHETGETANALGQLLAATGRFAEAGQAFERALKLAPDLAELRPQLAQIRRDSGDAQGAVTLLEDQLRRFPDDHVSALLLAQLAIARSDTASARALVDRVLKTDNEHREALLLRYLLELLTTRGAPPPTTPTSARTRAIAAAGGPRQLAEVLLEQGFTTEAMPLLAQALTDTPDDLMAPVMLVALLTADGRLKEASDLRQKTVAPLAPEDRAELEPLFDTAIAEALKARNGATAPLEGPL